MKKILMLMLGLVMMTSLFAQNDSLSAGPPKEKPKAHYIGVNAGFTTGLGLSYIYWPKKFGLQLAFLPVITKDNAWVSTAVTFLPSLVTIKNNVLFLFVGNHFIFSEGNDVLYNLGVGPGFEVGNQSVKFHFAFGFMAADLLGDVSLLPTGEIGLFYKF